jgi:hypothetical protein
MRFLLGLVAPGKAWLGIFGLWGLFLSGATADTVGTPGVLQALHMTHLLRAKQARVAEIEEAVLTLQNESLLLEKSGIAQQREIRRVLGYAAPDEMIFDFSSGERL